MAQTSGLESLLEALRQSGVNTDDVKGGNAGSAGSAGRKDSGAGGSGKGQGQGGGRDGVIPNIDLSFLEDFEGPKSKRTAILLTILAVLVLAVAYWWFHPPINIHSPATWTVIAVVVIVALVLLYARSRAYSNGTERLEKSPSKAKRYKWLCVIPLAVALVGVIGGVASMAIIPGNAARYASVLETDTLEFSEDIQEVDYTEVPIIDRDSAVLLGNREMGTISEYVSQFEISDLYSQINYQGEPVRVSPLGYADLFKWFTNREGGIPAYALVNMTTQEAEIVRLEDSPIYYSQSEPLSRNIDRYVQLKYPFYIFDEKSFEIDEDGHAWWICPVREYTIGLFGGTTIGRVVLVDATTGECQDLAVEDVPEWVDRVYPADLLVQQYNWYGSYNNGWLNSFLGQEGVVETTPGTDGELGYNYIAKDDDVWVYTGVTSATSDNSIIGFVLVNQRTQEAHFYSVSGATEDSAMESAEGQVQNLRYTATFPILINVADQPTYFMALKDSAGLVKKFAMVNIQSYQYVATGDTVEECQESYEELLVTNGVDIEEVDASVILSASGTIATMAQAVIDGNSHFYVTLEGDESIYDFSLPSLLDIITYQVGDSIEFAYLEGSDANTVYSLGDSVLESTGNDADAQTDADAEADDVDADADTSTDT